MARINLAQAINLNLMKKIGEKPVPVTIELKRGVNDIGEVLKAHPDLPEEMVLNHPYILQHVKLGGISLIPDPMDPEAKAAAAEEIARQARAEAEAFKALKDAEKAKVEGALKAASLKQDGPTVAEFIAAGYRASNYPLAGYASKSTDEEIEAAIAAQEADDAAKAVQKAAEDAEKAKVEGGGSASAGDKAAAETAPGTEKPAA